MWFRKPKMEKQEIKSSEQEIRAKKYMDDCKYSVEPELVNWMRLQYGTMYGGMPGRLRYALSVHDTRRNRELTPENAIGWIYAPESKDGSWDKIIVHTIQPGTGFPSNQEFAMDDPSAKKSFIRLLRTYERLYWDKSPYL